MRVSSHRESADDDRPVRVPSDACHEKHDPATHRCARRHLRTTAGLKPARETDAANDGRCVRLDHPAMPGFGASAHPYRPRHDDAKPRDARLPLRSRAESPNGRLANKAATRGPYHDPHTLWLWPSPQSPGGIGVQPGRPWRRSHHVDARHASCCPSRKCRHDRLVADRCHAGQRHAMPGIRIAHTCSPEIPS